MGVLYILDEPSIGLHQRDNDKLLATLKHLRDLGNTLIVVEHDEDTMRAADYLIDVGPGAGLHGGEVVAAGTPEEVMANPEEPDGAVSQRQKENPCARRAPPRKREVADGARRAGEQSEEHRRVHPAGDVYLRHRRLRQRQVLAGQRDPLSSAGRGAEPHEGAPGQASQHRGLEHLDKVDRHRPEPHRAHAPLEPGDVYGRCSTISAICLPPRRTPRRGATGRGGFPSIPRRPVRGLLRRRAAED